MCWAATTANVGRRLDIPRIIPQLHVDVTHVLDFHCFDSIYLGLMIVCSVVLS